MWVSDEQGRINRNWVFAIEIRISIGEKRDSKTLSNCPWPVGLLPTMKMIAKNELHEW
jgi:hypothetical protein